MVLERGKDETLDIGVDETQTETAAVDIAAIKKLLHQL